MSQQKLMPEPQSSRSSQESYNAQGQGKQSWPSAEMVQPYNRSQRSRTSDLPKSDHPSTFEESLPLYSYPAQDQTTFRQQSNSKQNKQWQQEERIRDASTAKEIPTGAYQPYSQYNPPQQVSWWVQSQGNTTDTSKWIGILLLVLVLLVSIPVVCSIGTVFVGVLFMFSLLPVLLAFAPIAIFLLLPLFRVLGPYGHDNRWRRRQRARYDHSWWW